MSDTRFGVSEVGEGSTWVVVDDSPRKQLVASTPSYACALMIAALMNGDMVQAILYRDELSRIKPDRTGFPTGSPNRKQLLSS